MSFYSRYNSFGAAADDRMVAAIAALNVADAAFAAANARVEAAKAAKAQLARMDSAWFKRVDSYFNSNGAYPGAPEVELYQKYKMMFPIDWSLPMPSGGGPPFDFDKENPVLEEDKQKADDEFWAATDAVPAARSARTAAQTAQDLAKKEIDAVNVTAKNNSVAAAKAAADATAKAKAAADAAAYAKLKSTQKQMAKSTGPSPLIIAAVAVPMLGAIIWALTRKKPAVAGYRRRSRR